MDKTNKLQVWQTLLASILIFLIAACGISPSTESPPYIHYKQSKSLNIHLEFDYPSSWIFSEEMRGANIMVLGLSDPRFLSIPTPSPAEPHPAWGDFGSVSIFIFPLESNWTLDLEVAAVKKANSGTDLVTISDDYEIKIDGYDAKVLEYQIEPSPDGYPSQMFERNIFFIVKSQIYKLFFTIAEKDRGGEFERGYEIFIDSLKIIR
jgi:hypothetical protein